MLVSNPPAFAGMARVMIAVAVQISLVLFILKNLKILAAKLVELF